MLLALKDIFILTDALEKHRLVSRGLFSIMYSVMPQIARMTMQHTISEDDCSGPTFEYFHFEPGVSEKTQLGELCQPTEAHSRSPLPGQELLTRLRDG